MNIRRRRTLDGCREIVTLLHGGEVPDEEYWMFLDLRDAEDGTLRAGGRFPTVEAGGHVGWSSYEREVGE